jgi:hypothetical protein
MAILSRDPDRSMMQDCAPKAIRVNGFRRLPFVVMAGLVPAIHVFCRRKKKDVDARDKPAHDDREVSEASTLTTDFAQPDSRGTSPRMTM